MTSKDGEMGVLVQRRGGSNRSGVGGGRTQYIAAFVVDVSIFIPPPLESSPGDGTP